MELISNANLQRIISIDELYGVYRESNSEELIIDLRPLEEFKLGQIEGSISLPAIKVSKSSLDLSAKKRLYLLCKDGKLAPQAAVEVASYYPDATVYYVGTGGFDDWVQKRYPIISGFAEVAQKKNGETEALGQNDADDRNIVKTTRLLPPGRREEVALALPATIRVFFFTYRGRASYLICDLKAKKAVSINPLIEIHHHIVDQMVRMGCDCIRAIYFKSLKFEDSPPPDVHARDFAKITFSEAVSADELCATKPFPWEEKIEFASDSRGNEAVVYRGVIFSSRGE